MYCIRSADESHSTSGERKTRCVNRVGIPCCIKRVV